MTITISATNVKKVLDGIDSVSERASTVISTIDKRALQDNNVTDLSVDDVKKRVTDKHTAPAPAVEVAETVAPKRPTLK